MTIAIINLAAEYIFFSAKREILCVPEHFKVFASRKNAEITLEKSMEILQKMVGEGYLRATQIEGHGRKIYFQPTPQGAEYRGKNVPNFLRSRPSEDAKRRGWLRANVIFCAPSGIDWLGIDAVDEMLKANNCGQNGFARPQVGSRTDGKIEIVFCILANENPRQIIESTASRLLTLLESDASCTLRFTCSRQNHERVAQALTLLTTSPLTQIEHEIAAIDAKIASDRTGLDSIQLGHSRGELCRKLAETAHDQPYQWLAATPICA